MAKVIKNEDGEVVANLSEESEERAKKRKKLPPPRQNLATRKNNRGAPAKYNWDLIYEEFVEGIKKQDAVSDNDRWFPNLKQLTERHGLSYHTIRERASNERWSEKKNAYQMEVVRARQQERARQIAKNASEFDEKAFKLGEMGVNLVTMRLAEIATEVQARRGVRQAAIEALQNGERIDKEDLRSAIWSRELESLAAAAERFQSVGMKSLGTDVNRTQISGPGGGPIEVDGQVAINISQEITRDDPERVALLLKSFDDAGMLPAGVIEQLGDTLVMDEDADEDENIIDAEIVEDGKGE